MSDRFTPAELMAIEAAAVRGWPALETREVGGWLARASSGGSVRANSVSALAWHGEDLETAFAEVERFYAARGASPRFTITEASRPVDLDDRLAARGYRRAGEHVTMAKRVVVKAVPPPPAGIVIEMSDRPSAGWYDAYLAGVTPDRRQVAPRLVDGVPKPRVFVSAIRDGAVIASGLSVHDGALASVQCMATRPEARRTGAARAVLSAIEESARTAGKTLLYLQADAENHAAIRLYESVGFSLAGRYHTRVRMA